MNVGELRESLAKMDADCEVVVDVVGKVEAYEAGEAEISEHFAVSEIDLVGWRPYKQCVVRLSKRLEIEVPRD